MSAVGLSSRGPLAAPMATAAFRAALAMDVKNSQGATQLLSDLGRHGEGCCLNFGGGGDECFFIDLLIIVSLVQLKKQCCIAILISLFSSVLNCIGKPSIF